ncbi:MAG: sigma-54-dependent Fis family transcriptional regulator [Bacillota bacterium]|nr:sigma-54-dependent Fis family transcriptional regulator [Bacillota bacterium]
MKREIELIINSTHDAMIAVDLEGIITLFNRAAEKLTRIDTRNAMGKYITNVIETTRLPFVLETGKSELNKRQLLGNIEIITNRMPVLNEDGEVVGAIAVFRDITDIVTLAEEVTDLKEIRGMLEAIFDATQDAISVVDKNGMGMLINPAYTRITGFSAKDIIGKKCTVDVSEGESVHLKVLSTGKPVKNARLFSGVNKKEVIVDAAPIIVNDELIGSVAVIHDLSEIKELTYKLDQAKRIIRTLEAKYTFDDIKGADKKLVDVIDKAKLAAETPVTVIIRGESGTGKELIAHAIHNASNRKFAQFVRVNCAAISESLLESELFGYKEGAFTGALKGGKIGYFEMADGGTIFLDEIAEINLNTQAKLLRVLQEKEIIRVGDTKPVPIDVRIITATNVDLEKAIEEGKFRKDLYYRLNVLPINMPSLREHKEDIDELVEFMIKKYNQEYGRNVVSVSADAINTLKKYDWPGNVRELENYIGRAMINIKMGDKIIDISHLPPILYDKIDNDEEMNNISTLKYREFDRDLKLRNVVESTEKKFIERILNENNYNRTMAAKSLGISVRSLYYKIEKYGIE